MSNTDKRILRKKGVYYLGGTPYPSVTSVLGVLNKPALSVWLQKNVYTYCKNNPDCTQIEALRYSKELSRKAMDRGTRVHDFIEKGEVDFMNIDPDIAPLMYAYNAWVSEYNPKTLYSELTVVNEEDCYAGTTDAIVDINGENWLIDYKTGKGLYETVYLQTAAYKRAVELSGIKIDRVGALVLLIDHNGNPTKDYIFKEIEEDHYPVFKSLLDVYSWTKSVT